jgi:hypothetical protein
MTHITMEQNCVVITCILQINNEQGSVINIQTPGMKLMHDRVIRYCLIKKFFFIGENCFYNKSYCCHSIIC